MILGAFWAGLAFERHPRALLLAGIPRMVALRSLRELSPGGPHALEEFRDPLTLIAAKTTVFVYSTTFDDLDLGGEQPRKRGPPDWRQPNLGALSSD